MCRIYKKCSKPRQERRICRNFRTYDVFTLWCVDTTVFLCSASSLNKPKQSYLQSYLPIVQGKTVVSAYNKLAAQLAYVCRYDCSAL
jgi:hypothetical protein